MKRWTGVAAAITIAVVAIGLLASQSAAAPATAPSAQDNAERGRDLYRRIGCYQCHGFVGQGAGTGPRLVPNLMPYSRFSAIVYEPLDLMPRYSPDYVSEQDLRDLYAYLETIPRWPSVDEIPLLLE